MTACQAARGDCKVDEKRALTILRWFGVPHRSACTRHRIPFGMKLHREVDITQKSAWPLAHRLGAMLAVSDVAPMAGPVEPDETFIGRKESNKHEKDRKHEPKICYRQLSMPS